MEIKILNFHRKTINDNNYGHDKWTFNAMNKITIWEVYDNRVRCLYEWMCITALQINIQFHV